MDLNQALALLEKYNKEHFHVVHGQTVSGVMGYFAKKYDPENENHWAVVGMLHDIDFELYPEAHCVKCMEIFKEENVSDDIANSCSSHGYGLCEGAPKPEHIMEKVLFATDELTGLIGAAARMRPSKSVSDMELSSLKKKFKDKKFAAGCSRDVIKDGAVMLEMELDELLGETLEAMKTLVGTIEGI